MSNTAARRTRLEVLFDGADISKSLEEYLLTMTYMDNEEDEADDLQLKLEDRDSVWLTRWLAATVQSAAAPSPAPASGNWKIGDNVTANGRPQYSSYGNGTPGTNVINHQGKVTYLNLKSGVPYPIHVDSLGWFAESQVQKAGTSDAATGPGKNVSALKIRAAIIRENWTGTGAKEKLDCGEFELDSLVASGPPAAVTIKASSLPFSSQIRQTKRSRAWEACKLSSVATELAAVNGMTCLYESKNDPAYERLEQTKTSDIRFLSKLCHDAGISLKVTDNKLVLFDQTVYEAKPPIATIRRGDGSYLKYKLNTSENDTQYASCRVSYLPPDGQLIEATAYVEDYDAKAQNNQCLEVTAKVPSIAEAQTLAEKQLRLRNKYAKTVSFTLPGNPSFVSGVTILLSGWGLWDGKYIIKQAVHTVGGSGYTVQINARSVLGGY